MEIKDLEGYIVGSKLAKKHSAEKIGDFTRPTFLQRNLASFIDFTIVMVIRMIIAFILVSIWYHIKIKKIIVSYQVNEVNVSEFVMKFGILYDLSYLALFTLLLGGLYYIFFYSSKYSATPGCKINHLILINKKGEKRISLFKSTMRYFLYMMPAIFIVIILFKYYVKSFDILFFFLIFLTMIWYDLSFFLRLRQSIPDIICRTVLVSTKPEVYSKPRKFPFFNFRK